MGERERSTERREGAPEAEKPEQQQLETECHEKNHLWVLPCPDQAAS